MRVVILDEDLTIADEIQSIFLTNQISCEISAAPTLTDFISLCRAQSFDLAILDVYCKGSPDGLEAGSYWRANFNLPMIFLTTASGEKEAEQILRLRPEAYVLKPLNKNHFSAILRQALNKTSPQFSLGHISVKEPSKGFIHPKIEFFQNTLDHLFITSITNSLGEIVYANTAFCRVSGYSPGELLGRNHNIVNSGFHDRAFFSTLWRTIKGGEIWQGEIRNQRKDGTFYWVASYVFALNTSGTNSEPYFISIRTDITDRKESEFQLKQILDQKLDELSDNRIELSRTAKDEALVGFNSILIHELKRPLTSLSFHLDDLFEQHERNLPEEVRGVLRTLRGNIAHTAKLLNYLSKTFRRKENKAKKEKIPLYGLIESVLDFMRILFPNQDIRFHFAPHKETLFILGYSDAIFIALFNLIKNSCESFTKNQSERWVRVRVLEDKTMNGIEIEDNVKGGIPELVVANLFSSVSSVKEGGSGIGLSITRYVLRSMDAKVELLRTGPSGSCFLISNLEKHQ